MGRNLFTSIFSIYLAALLLLGTTAQQLHEIRESQTSMALSNEPVAEQIKVNSLRPLIAEINFSGFQQIIIHPVKGFEKSKTTILKILEAQFIGKWKFAALSARSIEPGLSIFKIIFPSHFFW
jgi:hypothetical protein